MKTTITNGIKEFSLSKYFKSTELTLDDLKYLEQIIKENCPKNLENFTFHIRLCLKNNEIQVTKTEEIKQHKEFNLNHIKEISIYFNANNKYVCKNKNWKSVWIYFKKDNSLYNYIRVEGHNEIFVRGVIEQISNFINSKKAWYWFFNEVGFSYINFIFRYVLHILISAAILILSFKLFNVDYKYLKDFGFLWFLSYLGINNIIRKIFFPYFRLIEKKEENWFSNFLKDKEMHKQITISIISAIVGAISLAGFQYFFNAG